MNRRDWTPIRRVVEMLNEGHRNRLTFLYARELSDGRADQAIAELERRGLVKTTLSGVEPTAAFASWFADLRQREDPPEAVQLAALPPVVPQTAPEENVPVSACKIKRKRYFAHLSRDPHEARLEMAARIKETMEAMNRRTMTVSALKRSLHADRHPEAWKEAIRRLVAHRIAKVADGKITLEWSEFELPDPYGRPKPKRRKRNRGQSEWFEKNRAKMDDGQHTDFHEDWSEEDEELAAAKAFWAQLEVKDEKD